MTHRQRLSRSTTNLAEGQQTPRVKDAAIVTQLPGEGHHSDDSSPSTNILTAQGANLDASTVFVDPGYFAAIRFLCCGAASLRR